MNDRRRTGSIAALAIAVAALAGACGGGKPTGSASATTVVVPQSGSAAYALACATCHGADGSGGQGPAIGRTLAGSKYDQAALSMLITNGKGAMKGYAGDLDPATIEAIALYVRTELGQ